MLKHDRALVLKTSRYGDQSMIVHVFGRECGHAALFFKGSKIAQRDGRHLLQPLVPVFIQTEERSNQAMRKLTHVGLDLPLSSLATDPMKISLGFFLAEFLWKTMPQDYTNEGFFDFLRASVEVLDQEVRCANFHLWFIANVCNWYGLECEVWPTELVLSGPAVRETTVALFAQPYSEIREMKMLADVRAEVLDALLRYLRFRLNEPIPLKSLEVLQELFR
jgi:hypothetical protein